MGLRFRHTFKLFPGVKVNLGLRGVSASFGVPGMTVNVGRRGVRGNVGIPGSGLSYGGKLFPLSPDSKTPVAHWTPNTIGPVPAEMPHGHLRSPEALPTPPIPSMPAMRVIGSSPLETLTSAGLAELRQMITDARAQRDEIDRDLSEAKRELAVTEAELLRRKRSWLRRFQRKKIASAETAIPLLSEEVERLRAWSEATHIRIDFDSGEEAKRCYAQLTRSFEVLCRSAAIWDVTADRSANRVAERSAASRVLQRTSVKFEYSGSDLVLFDGRAMKFGNANGEDILIYPGVALMPRSDGELALMDIREVSVTYGGIRFVETEAIPPDAKVVDQTWLKVNKNGSPDRRFKGNCQIPVCLYGSMRLESSGGLLEEYQASSVQAVQAFGQALDAYKRALSA